MPSSDKIDSTLLEFATDQQARIARAVNATGSTAAAAKKLGLTASRVRGALTELRKRAAKRGWAPGHGLTNPSPPGFALRGVKIHRRLGEVVDTWEHHAPEQAARFEMLTQAIQDAADGWRGKAPPVKAPKYADKDLMAVYPWGDPHVGMFAWAQETGDKNFNLSTAQRVMFGAVDHLVALAPPADTALLISVGDLFHADNLQNRTARSGHALDVDSRYPKVYQVALETVLRCIDRCLEKHQRVKFISAIGNHDDVSAYTLAVAVAAFYSKEPRVEVDLQPGKFHWHRFGSNLIGVTHGDTVKPNQLPLLMAHDRAKDWGECEHRHWYTGHIHTRTVFEAGGCEVETLQTLTARDAYAAGHGYRSGQSMICDVWHRARGRINRHMVGVEQIFVED